MEFNYYITGNLYEIVDLYPLKTPTAIIAQKKKGKKQLQ